MALFFVLDRFLPPHGERSGGSEVGRPVIRIKSARTLPERIIFDTSTEIAATVSPPLRAAELPDHVASNASATAEPAKPQPNVRRRFDATHGKQPVSVRLVRPTRRTHIGSMGLRSWAVHFEAKPRDRGKKARAIASARRK